MSSKCSITHHSSLITSPIGNGLVSFLFVVRRSFQPARHLGLTLLLLIGFLAGLKRRRDRPGLPGRCIASCLRYFANLLGRCGIKLRCAISCRFVVLTCALAQFLSGFARFVDAFSGGVGNVAAQFLARFGREQQCENCTNTTTY